MKANMKVVDHHLPELFEQLGLPSDQKSILEFIEHHSLTRFDDLVDAPFWNASQREFLVQARLEDADWVGRVDLLDSLLRK